MSVTIYCATNIKNNKKYVGKSSRLIRRFQEHKMEAANNLQTPFHAAIRKYGFDSFIFSILRVCKSTKAANRAEKYFIRKLNTHVSGDRGYNVTFGGDGTEPGNKSPNFGIVRNRAYREKQSKSQKKVWKRSDLRKRRLASIRATKATQKHKKLISKINKKRWKNTEFRKKTSLAIRKSLNRPEVKKRQKEGILKAWRRPGAKKFRSASMRRGWAAR